MSDDFLDQAIKEIEEFRQSQGSAIVLPGSQQQPSRIEHLIAGFCFEECKREKNISEERIIFHLDRLCTHDRTIRFEYEYFIYCFNALLLNYIAEQGLNPAAIIDAL